MLTGWLSRPLIILYPCTCKEKEISHWEFEGTDAASCGEEYRAAALLMAPIHCIMSGASLVGEIEYKNSWKYHL